VSWKLAGTLALFIAALAYVVAKLRHPFDAEGRTQPLWKRRRAE